VQLLLLLKRVKVTAVVALLAEIPGSPAEDSLLPALDAKIVVFPSAELAPKTCPATPPGLGIPRLVSRPEGEEKFRGGSLRGLFFALLVEGAVIAVAAGAVLAWHTMR
jgi:hypothetical protein